VEKKRGLLEEKKEQEEKTHEGIMVDTTFLRIKEKILGVWEVIKAREPYFVKKRHAEEGGQKLDEGGVVLWIRGNTYSNVREGRHPFLRKKEGK